jgi:hypothetical protein
MSQLAGSEGRSVTVTTADNRPVKAFHGDAS